MDNLLEALKTGSAFNVNREKRDGKRRTPRAAGGKLRAKLHMYLLSRFRTICAIHGIVCFVFYIYTLEQLTLSYFTSLIFVIF